MSVVHAQGIQSDLDVT